jgi:hypothetical protein
MLEQSSANMLEQACAHMIGKAYFVNERLKYAQICGTRHTDTNQGTRERLKGWLADTSWARTSRVLTWVLPCGADELARGSRCQSRRVALLPPRLAPAQTPASTQRQWRPPFATRTHGSHARCRTASRTQTSPRRPGRGRRGAHRTRTRRAMPTSCTGWISWSSVG